jgi:hypothetical protein
VQADSRNALVDACPALDGVVFCAGLAAMRPMRMAGEDHLRQMLSITQNLYGPDADVTDMARVVENWAGCQIGSSEEK